MSIDPPVDPKKSSLTVIPAFARGIKRRLATAKSKSLENQQLVEKVKNIEFIREDLIGEVKLRILHSSYESSSILDSLADKLIEELS